MATLDYVDPIEVARERLKELIKRNNEKPLDLNEADTRFKLIDPLFFECLGWETDDVEMEKAQGREYADYTFSAPRPILILEAKRSGKSFEVPAGRSDLLQSLPSLLRSNPDLNDAANQVMRYCNARGVSLAVVSNGYQLVAFVAGRTDGVSPMQGAAIVFSSLDQMETDFIKLWNYLSKPGIEEKRIFAELIGGPSPIMPPKLSSFIDGYPGLKNRNPFQLDLQILSENIIEDAVKYAESEEQFLLNCYCKSDEISQYSVLSKDILVNRYSSLFDAEVRGPQITQATDANSIQVEMHETRRSSRPLLLIGDVGVGKTSFIRNLIKIEASEVLKDTYTFYIDLGVKAVLALDVRKFVVDEIARQLLIDYKIDIQNDEFVRNVYRNEIARFETGIYGRYKHTNFPLYEQKEIEELERHLVDKEVHLSHSLHHLSETLGSSIAIFLDNSDQRSEETQQLVF